MFEAVIFDLDGLMIDSEPLWREVESRIFSANGIPVTIDDCAQTMGLRIDEAIHFWKKKFPRVSLDVEKLQLEIIFEVKQLIEEKGEALPGVLSAINLLKQENIRLGLASSSSRELIDAVLNRFKLVDHFEVVCSAEDEKRGKPSPDVYLSTIEKLNLPATEVLALEDSSSGVCSAKAASLSCICIPGEFTDPTKLTVDLVINSLEELSVELLESVYSQRHITRA